ncbi:hypothetical protein [Bdellovibrio sp. HCB337]|uniref:hypothetical protein n=1 Tax=Bdellovibrio sp. HCB337 TaxID=3394358 RepID=UPI0039A4749B
MKNILRLTLVFSFLMTSIAFAEVDQDLIKKISRQDRDLIKAVVLTTFVTAQDTAYFEKIEQNYKPLGLHLSGSQKNGTLSIFGQDSDTTLSNFNPAQKSLKINGREFQIEKGKSLEYHVTKMSDILTRKKKKTAEVFWLSRAYASEADDESGIKSLFYAIPAAIAILNNDMAQDSLDAVLSKCSTDLTAQGYRFALTRLTFLESKREFTTEKQEKITDCKEWARQQPYSKKIGEPALIWRCETGHKVVTCMKNHPMREKSSSPQAPQGQGTRGVSQ